MAPEVFAFPFSFSGPGASLVGPEKYSFVYLQQNNQLFSMINPKLVSSK